MFGVPGESFVDNWLSLIVLIPLIAGVVYVVSKFTKTKVGKHVVNFLHKLFLAVTYPFYKIRSKLSDQGKSIFDGFFYSLYLIGALLLMFYGAS